MSVYSSVKVSIFGGKKNSINVMYDETGRPMLSAVIVSSQRMNGHQPSINMSETDTDQF